MEIEELFAEITKVRKEAEIKAIEIKSPKDVFGDKARSTRDVAVIYTDYGREAHVIPQGIKYDSEKKKWIVTDELLVVKSVRNPNSWFGKFFRRYRNFPTVGMKVILTVSGRGFTVIEV